MGANAQTSVPAFTAGQVLTAAQMTQVNTGIPVFASSTERDAAFGGAGEKTLAEGQMAYLENTNETQYYDGSAWTALGGGGGLTLITSTSFSGASAVSVDNCFTSNHTAYQIVFLATALGGGNLYMRFRNSGTDTAANYDVGEAIIRYSDGYFSNDGNGNAQTLMILGYISAARTQHTITVWEPYETQYTGMWYNASHPDFVEWGGAQHTVQTTFDGFTIYPSAGSVTGNVYVYGLATS